MAKKKWTVKENGGRMWVEEGGKSIAEVSRVEVDLEDGDVDVDETAMMRNGSLIGAAPALYEACLAMVKCGEADGPSFGAVLKMAKAAVRAAKQDLGVTADEAK